MVDKRKFFTQRCVLLGKSAVDYVDCAVEKPLINYICG